MILLTRRKEQIEHPRRRRVALGMIAFVSAANIYSLIALSKLLLHHHLRIHNGDELLFAGVVIWLTNFLIFGLWYWELDRGGPGKRATGERRSPRSAVPADVR